MYDLDTTYWNMHTSYISVPCCIMINFVVINNYAFAFCMFADLSLPIISVALILSLHLLCILIDAPTEVVCNQPGDVFVNNRLRLGDIQVYGFDYDFTLAEYKPDVLELLYRECLKYLIEEKKVCLVYL